jgi:hypothetical protein
MGNYSRVLPARSTAIPSSSGERNSLSDAVRVAENGLVCQDAEDVSVLYACTEPDVSGRIAPPSITMCVPVM